MNYISGEKLLRYLNTLERSADIFQHSLSCRKSRSIGCGCSLATVYELRFGSHSSTAFECGQAKCMDQLKERAVSVRSRSSIYFDNHSWLNCSLVLTHIIIFSWKILVCQLSQPFFFSIHYYFLAYLVCLSFIFEWMIFETNFFD